jgi:site-specific DNA recombinase
MKKTVMYVRVSTSEQNTDRQILDLERYAKEKNLEVAKIFSETISASKKEFHQRKEFNLMLKYIEKNKIKNIVVAEVSRISRQSIQIANFLHDCNAEQINISIQHGNLNTLYEDGSIDRTSQLFVAILASIAEQETATLGQRIISGKRSEALKGNSYHGQLYGYDKIDGKPVINQEEAIVVRKMFEMLIQGIGCRKISNYLNENNNHKKVWSVGGVHSIVTNPFFMGQRKFKDIIIPVDPIISEQIFISAQSFIKSRFRFVSDSKHPNPFASFIKCICGATFNQTIIPANRSNLYKCRDNCGIASVNRPYLISEIKSLLEKNAKLTQDKQARIKFNLQIKANKATIEKNQKRLDNLQRMSIRNYDYLTAEKISEKQFDETSFRYENEKSKLQEVNFKLNEVNQAIFNSLQNEILHYSDNLEIFKSQLLPILESIVIGKTHCTINLKGFSMMYFYIFRGPELQLYKNHIKKHGNNVEFKPTFKIDELDEGTQMLINSHLNPYL